MVSQDKLIKQGIKYTDSLFAEISKRLEQGVRQCDTLEEFLSKYKEYTDGKGENNPLVVNGYKDQMLKIILAETNNHKFSRPSQKELTRIVIENKVGELITNVGEDIQENVRDIVKEGYNQGLPQEEIATNITVKVNGIKETRAKSIARTEIARTATISDYIINKERGATHFYVECRNTACPICKEAWHKHWSKANDESFTPKDSSAGGKGWIGDRTYSMQDTAMLPPIHPNCRCVPYFISEDDVDGPVEPVSLTKPTPTNTTETTETTEPASTNSMLKGKPTVHTERDSTNGSQVTVYRYENGFELAISQNADFSFEDIVAHIESLPEPLKNIDTLKRINIKDHYHKSAAGEYYDVGKFINLYQNNKGAQALDTLTHELAHALDGSQKIIRNYHLSFVDVYDKIFKADNKLYTYVNETTGRKRTVKKFPTDYAKRSYVKYKKQFNKHTKLASPELRKTLTNKIFVEDFAESTKLYLNPKTHSKFVKDFPNRAKYLESIYGKPTFDKNSPLSKLLADEEKQQLKKELAKKESQLKEERFNKLTKKEFDTELEKILGDKEKVKKYHAIEKEFEKLNTVQRAIGFYDDVPSRVKLLTEVGWEESTAIDIAKNPNKYLQKVNAEKRKYREVLETTKQLVKENIDLTKPVTKTETEKETTKPQTTTSKPKTEEKPKETKEKTTPKQKDIDPVKNGKVKKITYEEYPHLDYTGPKVIEYENGTVIKFKPIVTNPEAPEYTELTIDEITYNGKTIKYKKQGATYDDFLYQDKQLTKKELEFADEFIKYYGTSAGIAFNQYKLGKMSDKEYNEVKNDKAFKFLVKNADKYDKILEKSTIEKDIITARVKWNNHVKETDKHIQDPMYTSSSAGRAITNLIDTFANARDIEDNWKYITITPAGTKGCRFQGNSIARNEGGRDMDFEEEITYKRNFKFDILLYDPRNKIVLLTPSR